MPEAPASVHTPATLRWAVVLLAAEALALGVLLVFLLYSDLTADSGPVRGAIGTTVFTALFAGLLGLFAWSLHRRRGWARGPAIVLQLLLLPIGYYMATGGLTGLGIVVIAIGLLGGGVLLAPATRGALVRD